MRRFFCCIAVVVFFWACTKDKTTEGPKAYISLINAAPGSDPVTLFLDNEQLNETPVPYGAASGTATTAYVSAGPGVRTTTWQVGATVVSDGKFLAWQPGNYYTMIHFDTLVNQVGSLFLLNDNPQPNDSVGKVRFINCLVGSDSLILWLIRRLNNTRSDTVRVASKQVYLGVNSNINGAYNSVVQPLRYDLQLLERDSSLLFRDSVDFQKQNLYTVVAMGVKGETGDKSPVAEVIVQSK